MSYVRHLKSSAAEAQTHALFSYEQNDSTITFKMTTDLPSPAHSFKCIVEVNYKKMRFVQSEKRIK